MDSTGAPYNLPYPAGSDPADISQIGDLAEAIAAIMATAYEGPIDDRPDPGKLGRYWVVTHALSDVVELTFDTGNDWVQIWPAKDFAVDMATQAELDAKQSKLIHGRVTGRGTNGACTIKSGSGGFTVARTNPGEYRITFITAFAQRPTVTTTAEILGNIAIVDYADGETTTGITVNIGRYDTSAIYQNADVDFHFIAAG